MARGQFPELEDQKRRAVLVLREWDGGGDTGVHGVPVECSLQGCK